MEATCVERVGSKASFRRLGRGERRRGRRKGEKGVGVGVVGRSKRSKK